MTFLFVSHTHEQLINFDTGVMIRLTWVFYVTVFRIAGDLRTMWFHVVVICWKLNTISDCEVDFFLPSLYTITQDLTWQLANHALWRRLTLTRRSRIHAVYRWCPFSVITDVVSS